MNVEFLSHFHKDLQKIKQQSVLDEIKEAILSAEHATGLSSLKNLKKLKGYKNVYRL